MSDEKEQDPNSPSQEESTFKRSDFAEKTLPRLNIAAETMSINDNNNDLFFKNMNLDELQKQAYYNVLHVFSAESSEISSQRVSIIQELMKEWNIAQETHTAFEDKLKTEPLVKQLREASSESDKNEEDLLIVQAKNAKPSSTSDDSPFPGWGQVSPESLVDKWINIRISDEEEYIAFHIIDYNPEKETHRLVTALSKKELNDPCDWVDLRHIPAEDIIWQEGLTGVPTRTCFLKPGQTLLHETTTGRKRKQLDEVGETASGTPVQ